MKKFLFALAMLLCILLTCSAAFAAEAADTCPYCGSDNIRYSPNSPPGPGYSTSHEARCLSCGKDEFHWGKHTPLEGTASCSRGPQCSLCGTTIWDPSTFDSTKHRWYVNYTTTPSPYEHLGSAIDALTYFLTADIYLTPYRECLDCPVEETGTCVALNVTSTFSCTEGGTISLSADFKEDWIADTRETLDALPIGEHLFGKSVTVEPTCTKAGSVTKTCTLCGKRSFRTIAPAGLHWFGAWTANSETAGIHNAACRNEGCTHIGKAACAAFEVTVGDSVLSVCPVCGQFDDAAFEIVKGASMTSATKMMLPMGEALVRGIADPFDGVLYAFTASYEYSGESIPFGTTVSVSVPLSGEQFASFELLRVDVTPATETEERSEVRTAVEYTYENGVLTFEADSAALYLVAAASLQ